MEELTRWGAVAGICVYVIAVAWMSRRVALSMDERGFDGWIYGLATFIVPPLGLMACALDRTREPTAYGIGRGALSLGVLVLLLTFPWGLLLIPLLRRKAAGP